MTSINYDQIKSRFLSKIEDYSFLKQNEKFNDEFIKEWLRSVIGMPYIRRVFDTITVNEDNLTIEFEINNPVDDLSDSEYVIELFAMGIVIRWMEPKVKSVINLKQMYGSKEEKWFSEANHLNAINALYKDTQNDLKKLIRDHGYIYNSYIGS
jgi:hypothetical protein